MYGYVYFMNNNLNIYYTYGIVISYKSAQYSELTLVMMLIINSHLI